MQRKQSPIRVDNVFYDGCEQGWYDAAEIARAAIANTAQQEDV